MHVENLLKKTITSILRRHIEAMADEIACAMADEVEDLVRHRLADLHMQVESETRNRHESEAILFPPNGAPTGA